MKLQMEAERRGKLVPKEELRQQLVQQAHAIGHFGVEHNFRRIWEQGYWWPTLRQELTAEVKACIPCQRFNVIQAGYHPLMSIEADMPWDHVEIDLVGPIPISEQGCDYYLTCVDVMSGYTVLRALKGKAMDTVATAIWGVFCEYGTPKIIQSDNGTEFVNQLLRQLLMTFGVEHRLITAYHPRANGLVERTNKDASRILKKVMIGATQMWEQWLPAIQLALNTRVLERTGSTPFAVMHGRTFNGFSDFSMVSEATDTKAALERIFERRKELQEVILPAMRERVTHQRNKTKHQFDTTNKRAKSLEIGSTVYAIDQTKTSKWEPVYEGPFTIAEKHEGGTYSLTDVTGERINRRMTIDMLKPVLQQQKQTELSMVEPSGREDENRKADQTASKKKKKKKKASAVTHKRGQTAPTTDYYTLERILGHKMVQGRYQYLVRWLGYNETEDSWVNASDFSDTAIIRRYWQDWRKAKLRDI